MGRSGWNPWRELRARSHLRLAWAPLDGCRGMLVDGNPRTVYLDPRLGRVERNAVLAHELVHDERDVLYDDTTPKALIEKEEGYVNRETARRLVPEYELRALVKRHAELGEPVSAVDVMMEFDVPVDVANLALFLLGQSVTPPA